MWKSKNKQKYEENHNKNNYFEFLTWINIEKRTESKFLKCNNTATYKHDG